MFHVIFCVLFLGSVFASGSSEPPVIPSAEGAYQDSLFMDDSEELKERLRAHERELWDRRRRKLCNTLEKMEPVVIHYNAMSSGEVAIRGALEYERDHGGDDIMKPFSGVVFECCNRRAKPRTVACAGQTYPGLGGEENEMLFRERRRSLGVELSRRDRIYCRGCYRKARCSYSWCPACKIRPFQADSLRYFSLRQGQRPVRCACCGGMITHSHPQFGLLTAAELDRVPVAEVVTVPESASGGGRSSTACHHEPAGKAREEGAE